MPALVSLYLTTNLVAKDAIIDAPPRLSPQPVGILHMVYPSLLISKNKNKFQL